MKFNQLVQKSKLKVLTQLILKKEDLKDLGEYGYKYKINVLKIPKDLKDLEHNNLNTLKQQVLNNNGCIIYY